MVLDMAGSLPEENHYPAPNLQRGIAGGAEGRRPQTIASPKAFGQFL